MIAWVGDAELQAIKRRTKARLDRARAQGKTLRRPWSAHTGFILRFNRVDFQGGGGGGKHFYHRPLYHRPGSADLRTRSASPHWTVSLAGSSLDRWAYTYRIANFSLGGLDIGKKGTIRRFQNYICGWLALHYPRTV